MGIIMRNNIAYSGSGGSETIELSMAEYEAREAAGAIDSDTWYLIYDATDSYNAKKVVYDNAESGMAARTVQGAIDELNSNLPFKLGIDENGNYGYIKEGADSVTPFKNVEVLTSIPFSGSGTYRDGYYTELHGNISSKYTNYKNITINNLYIAFKRFPHGIASGNTQYFNYEPSTGLIKITASGSDTRFFINGTFYADIVIIK